MPSVTLSYFGHPLFSVCLSVLSAHSFSCAPPSVTNPSGAAPRPFLSFTRIRDQRQASVLKSPLPRSPGLCARWRGKSCAQRCILSRGPPWREPCATTVPGEGGHPAPSRGTQVSLSVLPRNLQKSARAGTGLGRTVSQCHRYMYVW